MHVTFLHATYKRMYSCMLSCSRVPCKSELSCRTTIRQRLWLHTYSLPQCLTIRFNHDHFVQCTCMHIWCSDVRHTHSAMHNRCWIQLSSSRHALGDVAYVGFDSSAVTAHKAHKAAQSVGPRLILHIAHKHHSMCCCSCRPFLHSTCQKRTGCVCCCTCYGTCIWA